MRARLTIKQKIIVFLVRMSCKKNRCQFCAHNDDGERKNIVTLQFIYLLWCLEAA